MARAPKGTVSIGSNDGRLRLRWQYGGKRHQLAIGLPDTALNRTVAQRRAALIEEDIRAGVFDTTLARYKTDAGTDQQLTVVEVFERYTAHKRRELNDSRSLEKYDGLIGHLKEYFRGRSASITEDMAFSFRDWLLKQVQPITAKERMGMLRSAWDWAMHRSLVSSNPWQDVKVKVPPKQKPRPFTQEEIAKIFERVRSSGPYQHYADFIVFCLSLGCRPGEAAGLRWKHLTEDCQQIWIGESWGRGRQKATKNNQARAFELTAEIREMLLQRRPKKPKANDLVFFSPEGCPIDDHNFRKRVWKPLLEELDIPYRKPYQTRHTFTSHALDQGWSLSEISAITGNTEETILRNYVGNPRGKSKLRSLYN
jgi:integrase